MNELANLIIGGDSVIGKALSKYWTANGVWHLSSTRRLNLVGSDRPYIDLEKQEWSAILENDYNAVVFCAAVSKISDCENQPELSRNINVESPTKLAGLLECRSKYLLLLSSNQVFSGKNSFYKVGDAKNPINAYGRQKSEVEDEFLNLSNVGVLRLTKVIHANLELLALWKTELKMGRNVKAFSDMYISPIYLDEVVNKIDLLVDSAKTGVYHFSGKSTLSYYKLACNLCEKLNISKSLVVSCCRDPHMPEFSKLV